MNKSLDISNPAFTSPSSPTGFNLVSTVNTFTSIFDPQPLEHGEEVDLQKLLFENFQLTDSEDNEKDRIAQDFQQIKSLTVEIKAIQKQSLVLVGERLNKVRAIFRSYKDGTFTQWLKSTFKSKQTGYNILAFYEFYSALPSLELKNIFASLPQKTAYLLASRAGEMDAKMQILQNPALSQQGVDHLPLIREKLPLSSEDKRKTKGETSKLLDNLLKSARLLHARNEKITDGMREKLKALQSLIDDLLSTN
jgi:hypothetical protein